MTPKKADFNRAAEPLTSNVNFRDDSRACAPAGLSRPRNSLLSLMQLRAYALSRLVDGKEIRIDASMMLNR